MDNEQLNADPPSVSTGKYMASVKVGSKGQIVIPKEARDLFKIVCGDTLLLRADAKGGIAIQPFYMVKDLFNDLFK